MSDYTELGISFDLPKNQSNVIKVIGVGGGGSNAINHMFKEGIKGVDFIVCNTDSQALQNSPVPNKVQLGVELTEGLGAGANPEVGQQAAIESIHEIEKMLDTNTKMVFITAGMGGGTGTGAAPVIAQLAKERDILTVGIVTIPFQFEGKVRAEQARAGVERLRKHVDSLIVINNNKLREVYGNLGFKAGFSKADEVLSTASRGIAEVITHHYTQNIDLKDAKTVLSNSGTAIMGSASAIGQDRAKEAIMAALDSPLLNDNKITGAKNVLLLIVSGTSEITIDEIGEINDFIQSEAGHNANIIMGVGEDESLGDAIAVTVIATGFNIDQQKAFVNDTPTIIKHTLGNGDHKVEQVLSPNTTGSSLSLGQTPLASEPAQRIVHTLDNNGEFQPAQPAQPVAPKAESFNFTIETPAQTLGNDQSNNGNWGGVQTPQAAVNQMAQQPVAVRQIVDEFIPTSEYIKNLDVVFEVVNASKEPAFQITPAARALEVREPQFVPSFQPEVSVYDAVPSQVATPAGVHHMEVREPQFVQANAQQDKVVYSLEDYMQVEDQLMNSKPVEVEEENTPEVVFQVRYEEPKQPEITPQVNVQQPTPATPVNEHPLAGFAQSNPLSTPAPAKRPEFPSNYEEVNPLEMSIEETLRARADERRRKLKDFNYKFHNSPNKIDQFEREPAYKRSGIDITSRPLNQGSRTSLGMDSNNDVQLRSNNSFLHDNVD